MKRPVQLLTWYLLRSELQYRLNTEVAIKGATLDLMGRINIVRHNRKRLERENERACKYCGIVTSEPEENCYKNQGASARNDG